MQIENDLDRRLGEANHNKHAMQQDNQAQASGKKNNDDDDVKLTAVREDIANVLKATPVSKLQFAAQAIVLDHKLNPKKAIQTLLNYKIRAAPVIDGNQFIGVLDLRDTVKYALESYHLSKDDKLAQIDEQKQGQGGQNENEDDDAAQSGGGGGGGDQQVKHLFDHKHLQTLKLAELCKHRPFRYVNSDDSAFNVAQLFAAGCHVVGVVDTKNDKHELVGVITQGYFYGQVASMWKFKHNCTLQQLMDLKFVTAPVISINRTMLASEAFQMMVDKDLSGLAVCNENGEIIHNTSATDIKLWLLSDKSLESTIEQFLISVRNLSLIDRFPVCTVPLTDTFKRAVQMLHATKYHRIWVVYDRRPMGVLALTDIFKFVCQQ
mmetsp:Transcript_29855/g.48619  ORF Transcript_29855/g.48619 Transcript_29855/m.48619 type:complete len:378 (+) Transcript_29855:57-1190(+)